MVAGLHGCRDSAIVVNDMIKSFRDATTEDFFHGRRTARARKIPQAIWKAATRKLDAVNAATVLEDLASPPGNCLEALKGDLDGFHSIRINEQWRLIFKWEGTDAYEVQIADYHG